ncbi:hypothetical protein BDV28DRAFT_103889 [Aspergillus coremiiformis]|uniref:Uncharacterized protein n=1 Tax=Aspergillus coremiiformis TaxID=138285 RepID=A0A5N6YS20_9EURO|nr:hypothetical protein BDV28DRAFT_103889 [Aspergillus coremiiformis]
MGDSDNPAHTLLTILKDRDIPVKCTEVASAFTNGKESTENAKWVIEHLTRDTLLSREELTLYTKLENVCTLRNITHGLDTDASRPFLDEDIRKAINSLNASTAVVQKQTGILASQCESIDKQLRWEGERRVRFSRNIERMRQRHESQRQNTNVASSELAHKVSAGLKIASENVAVDSKRILSSLASWLKEDDGILADLEQLTSGISLIGDDASAVKRTSGLSTILAQCLAEEIQCRLDRVYLENLRAGQFKVTRKPDMSECEGLLALEGELEALYPEIDILAEMYTRQHYATPILQELQLHHGQLRISSHKKLDYISDLITEMTLSTERLIKSLQDRVSFCGTLHAFDTTYRTRIGDRFSTMSIPRRETSTRRETQPTLTSTPSAKRIGSLSQSQALATILRRTGLPSELVFQSEEDNEGVNALSEKRQYMVDCLNNYGIAADAPLIAEMISSDQATRLLSSSLNTNLHVGTLITKVTREARLSQLESTLAHIHKGVDKLDLDVLYRRDRNQEEFMESWGVT